MTRREFFKKLAVFAAAAAVAPKVVTEAIETFAVKAEPTPPPLTYAMLEEAYQTVIFGREEPDMIVMSLDVYAEFRRLLEGLNRKLGRPTYVFYDKNTETICPRFNNADVCASEHLAPGTWLEVNSAKLDPRLSGLFDKAIEWKPIPEDVLANLQL